MKDIYFTHQFFSTKNLEFDPSPLDTLVYFQVEILVFIIRFPELSAMSSNRTTILNKEQGSYCFTMQIEYQTNSCWKFYIPYRARFPATLLLQTITSPQFHKIFHKNHKNVCRMWFLKPFILIVIWNQVRKCLVSCFIIPVKVIIFRVYQYWANSRVILHFYSIEYTFFTCFYFRAK